MQDILNNNIKQLKTISKKISIRGNIFQIYRININQ